MSNDRSASDLIARMIQREHVLLDQELQLARNFPVSDHLITVVAHTPSTQEKPHSELALVSGSTAEPATRFALTLSNGTAERKALKTMKALIGKQPVFLLGNLPQDVLDQIGAPETSAQVNLPAEVRQLLASIPQTGHALSNAMRFYRIVKYCQNKE